MVRAPCGTGTARPITPRPLRRSQSRCPHDRATACAIAARPSRMARPCLPLWRKYCSRHCGATIADIVITLPLRRGYRSCCPCGADTDYVIAAQTLRKLRSCCPCGADTDCTACSADTACAIAAPPPRSSQLRRICGADTARVTAVRPLWISQTRCPRGVATTYAVVAWQSRRSRLCLLLRRGYCSLHCGAAITEIVITRAPAARPLLAPLPRSHRGDCDCSTTVARPCVVTTAMFSDCKVFVITRTLGSGVAYL